jgi:O-antigen/teichoic acid export membrane protein
MNGLIARIKAEQWLVVFAQSVEMVGGLLLFKLLTVYLTKADMGNYLLAASVMAFVMTVSFSVMDQGLMRFVSIYESKNNLKEMYSACMFVYGLAAFLLALIFMCVSVLIGIDTRWGGMLVGLSFWILTEPIKNLALAMSTATRDRMVIASAKALDHFVRVGSVLLVALLFSLESMKVLILFAMSGACAGALLLWSQRAFLGKFWKHHIRKVFADMLGFSWPLYVWGIFGWLQHMSNRWLLETYNSAEQVANYGVLASLATLPFTMILGVVNSYALPIIYQGENTDPGSARGKVGMILRRLIPLLASVVVLTIFFRRDIILIAATQDYLQDAWLLPLMTAGVALSTLGTVMTYKDFATHQTRRLILPNVLPGILALVSGVLLVPALGVHGAAASFVLAHALSCLMQLLNFNRR